MADECLYLVALVGKPWRCRNVAVLILRWVEEGHSCWLEKKRAIVMVLDSVVFPPVLVLEENCAQEQEGQILAPGIRGNNF